MEKSPILWRLAALLIFFGMLLAVDAGALAGPSFRCAPENGLAERTICKNEELSRLDADMARRYETLRITLSTAEQAHLTRDQLRWLARLRYCETDVESIENCLKHAYLQRIERLGVLGIQPYPFVSEHWILRRGEVAGNSFDIEASFLRFDAVPTRADIRRTDVWYADRARQWAEDTERCAKDPPPGLPNGIKFIFVQSSEFLRPTPYAASLVFGWWKYTGGAHGMGENYSALIDLRTGLAFRMDRVFSPIDQFVNILTPLVAARLHEIFGDNKCVDMYGPVDYQRVLRDFSRYVFREDRLELIFNLYEIAPYVCGAPRVDIPYETLRSFFRQDGPLAALRTAKP